MRLGILLVLWALAACVEPTPTPDVKGDTAAEDTAAADTDDTDDPDTIDTAETDEPADTGPPPVTLSSDDAVSAGDCPSVTRICTAGVCTLEVHVETVTVSGTLADVDAASGDWRLYFDDPTLDIGWGGYIPFGTVSARVTDAAYTVRVFPGVYTLALDRGTPSSASYQHFPIAEGYALTGDTTLDVDLPFRTVTGVVRVNGADFEPDGSVLVFEDASTGALARVPFEGSSAYEALLPDGTWEVSVDVDGVRGLAEGVYEVGVVTIDGADVTADLDVEAYEVGGSILVEGAPLPDLGEESAWLLHFVDDTGREMETYLRSGDTWSVALPPGTWDAWVGRYLVGRDIVVSGPTTADLTEITVDVTSALLVDGGSPPGWYLVLLDDRGSEYPLENSAINAVPPGVYDIQVRRTSSAGIQLLAEDVEITAATTLEYAIATAEVSGAEISVNGRAPTEWWRVVLVDTASGARNIADGGSSESAWSATLPVGTYDVYVWFEDMYVAVARGLPVEEDVCLDLHVNIYAIEGEVLLDGAVPFGGDDLWTFFWHDAALGDTRNESFLVRSPSPGWTVSLPAGVYTFLTAFDVLTEEGTYHSVPVLTCAEVGPS